MSVLDETASWYQPPTNPTPMDTLSNSEGEASEADPLVEEDINTLEESLISFQLSGLNEDLSREVEEMKKSKNPSRMKSSISVRLKKPRTDARGAIRRARPT